MRYELNLHKAAIIKKKKHRHNLSFKVISLATVSESEMKGMKGNENKAVL